MIQVSIGSGYHTAPFGGGAPIGFKGHDSGMASHRARFAGVEFLVQEKDYSSESTSVTMVAANMFFLLLGEKFRLHPHFTLSRLIRP